MLPPWWWKSRADHDECTNLQELFMFSRPTRHVRSEYYLAMEEVLMEYLKTVRQTVFQIMEAHANDELQQ
jgi:hypothetical protein